MDETHSSEVMLECQVDETQSSEVILQSQVDETQSCEVSSTDQVSEPITEPVHVPVETNNTELTAPVSEIIIYDNILSYNIYILKCRLKLAANQRLQI